VERAHEEGRALGCAGARQASFGGLGWRGGLGMVGGCALACWDEGRVLECAGELAGRVLER
jgi:hypothetical protein